MTPRIVAALCWYDEPVPALERLVWTLASSRIADALVAADGPFALYGGDPASPREQRRAIERVAGDEGLPVEFLEPRRWSTQMAKRKLLTTWATTTKIDGRHVGSEDWMLVIDGDEWIRIGHPDQLREVLATTERDVAYVSGEDTGRRGELGRWRRLFRCLPNLTVWESHQEYVLVDGPRIVRRLHGNLIEGPLEEAEDASELVVLGHEARGRSEERQKAARRYYVLRNQSTTER